MCQTRLKLKTDRFNILNSVRGMPFRVNVSSYTELEKNSQIQTYQKFSEGLRGDSTYEESSRELR